MPIRNFPFIQIKKDRYPRPWLPVKIINPEKGLFIKTVGLIDTGADECSVPIGIAKELGYDLSKIRPKPVTTASGVGTAYSIVTTIEIYDIEFKKVLYKIPDISVDFTKGLHCVLLGMENFLEQFVLEINYPKKVFHIRRTR